MMGGIKFIEIQIKLHQHIANFNGHVLMVDLSKYDLRI